MLQVPKPPRARSDQRKGDDIQASTKKVSFSDELAVVAENDKTHMERMEEIGNSTTWQQMKQNYTTWGQIKCDRADYKKSNSVGDIRREVSKHKIAEFLNREIVCCFCCTNLVTYYNK